MLTSNKPIKTKDLSIRFFAKNGKRLVPSSLSKSNVVRLLRSGKVSHYSIYYSNIIIDGKLLLDYPNFSGKFFVNLKERSASQEYSRILELSKTIVDLLNRNLVLIEGMSNEDFFRKPVLFDFQLRFYDFNNKRLPIKPGVTRRSELIKYLKSNKISHVIIYYKNMKVDKRFFPSFPKFDGKIPLDFYSFSYGDRSAEARYEYFLRFLNIVFEKISEAYTQRNITLFKYYNIMMLRYLGSEKLIKKLTKIRKTLFTRKGYPYEVVDLRREYITNTDEYRKYVDIYSIQHHRGVTNDKRDVIALNVDFKRAFILRPENYKDFIQYYTGVLRPQFIEFFKTIPIVKDTTYNLTLKTVPLDGDYRELTPQELSVGVASAFGRERKTAMGGVSSISDLFLGRNRKLMLQNFLSNVDENFKNVFESSIRQSLETYMRKMRLIYRVTGFILKFNYPKKA